MSGSRAAFLQKLSASLIVPIICLPIAAVLIAVGRVAGWGPAEAAGMDLIRLWVPLLYGVGVSVGFTESDGMAALSTAIGFLVMFRVADGIANDPAFTPGVLGGLVVGALISYLHNRVKRVALPEYLGLFSGPRLGPPVGALAGVGLGILFGVAWPAFKAGVVALGAGLQAAGPVGAFAYGAVVRLLIPTGLHHLLLQTVDTQVGGWVDPASGRLVAGEYLRFLAGDPAAGFILSGFFLSTGFAAVGAAAALLHESRADQRKRVLALLSPGVLAALVLGTTEVVEFAYIFASPLLYGFHVIMSGLANLIGWVLEIRMGGYGLPLVLVNWHRGQNAWLILPLGLGYTMVYYTVFRALIRWRRPAVLGQVQEPSPAPTATSPVESGAYLEALGGRANILEFQACMTRLRLILSDPDRLDEPALKRLGVSTVLRHPGGSVHLVVGARAAKVAAGLGLIVIASPLSGRLVPLEQVPDQVFAERLVGDGVAIDPSDGNLVSPVDGTVIMIAPTGHALGILGTGGLEILIHLGINTVELGGEGFALRVVEGQRVAVGEALGRFDIDLIRSRGKSLITPVLVTNPEGVRGLSVADQATVAAGEPLLRMELTKRQ